jgi:uncharacterized damage-inducible protein DinB
MNPADPIAVLLAHDRWASHRMLDACAPLTEEQLHRRFEIGCGSLHNNAAHIVMAMRVWTDTLGMRTPRPRLDETERRTVAELRSLLDEAATDLAACAVMGPPDQMLTRERNGQVYTFTRTVIIVHVTTHGMHHRAQSINMLRQLGVGGASLPQSSTADWSRAGCPER